MTASNAPLSNAPLSTASVDSERRAHEPSMEEILASIRKIIADEEALPLGRPSAVFAEARAAMRQSAPEAPREPASVTPLPQARVPDVAASDFVAPDFAAPDFATPEVAAPESSAQEIAHIPQDIAPDGEPHIDHEMLEEPQVAQAVAGEDFGDDGAEDSAAAHPIDAYAPTVVAYESAPDEEPILSPSANASVASAFQALSASVSIANAEMIERNVREMLRPMLKQWLDDNLPVMVERLVRAEIERVARGGR